MFSDFESSIENKAHEALKFRLPPLKASSKAGGENLQSEFLLESGKNLKRKKNTDNLKNSEATTSEDSESSENDSEED